MPLITSSSFSKGSDSSSTFFSDSEDTIQMSEKAFRSKSPLAGCFPSMFTKFSSQKSKSKSSKSRSGKQGIITDEAEALSDNELQRSSATQNYNFNNVINFSPEEIIPCEYDLEDDLKSDQLIFSKFNLKTLDNLGKSAAVNKVNTTQRLHRLRQLMISNNIDVYIVPSEDEHQSEYTAACDQRREYISGFSGSAGVAIVSLTKAALSTDSRYFLEAEKQLDSNWELLKQGAPGYPTWQEWTMSELRSTKGKTLSVDPKLLSLNYGTFFEQKCKQVGCNFQPLYNNLIDEIWDTQPQRPNDLVYELPYKFSGEASGEKITRIRQEMRKKHACGIILTKLDEIAWVLNLRGNDFDDCPVFFAYLIILEEEVKLYLDSNKINKQVENYLHVEISNLVIKDYSNFWIDISALTINFESYFYLLSPDVSYGLINKLSVVNYKHSNFVEEFKSVKNQAELYGMRLSHVRDGVALARFFAWLQEKLIAEGRVLNEYQAALKNEYYKSLMSNFKGMSFQTISSSGANAASNHYEPTYEVNSIIDPNKIYLCDSGAQYLDGTTDITRTVHFKEPTKEEKIAYTAVLRGHIALSLAKFPHSATGLTLDTLARAPLWEEGLEYRHGTGHGIGSFLNVHEGPNYFGRNVTFESGQIISNEPGYYKDYSFGVRLESDMEVLKDKDHKDLNGKPFLRFGYLTLCPFDRKMIILEKLTQFELEWLNSYHLHVRNILTPFLMKFNDIRAAKWLYNETQPLK